MFDLEVLDAALAWHRAGEEAALAVVTGTWGSAPRPAGSLMAVRLDGAFVGSVSGGCVEAEVITAAAEVLDSGCARALTLGVEDAQAFGLGLACGGQLTVWVLPIDEALGRALALVRESWAARRVAVLALGEGEARALREGDSLDAFSASLKEAISASLRDGATRALAAHEGEGERVVLGVIPAPRLVLVGAVHVAQPLAAMAALAGLEVVVIDPRARFATEARFPGVSLRVGWPEEALPGLSLDARTALVALSHDPRLDEPPLRAALASDAFYVGALGSRRAHAERLARLRDSGVGAEALARLRGGPVGLPIGARGPGEIAVSILAEVVEALRGVGERGAGGERALVGERGVGGARRA